MYPFAGVPFTAKGCGTRRTGKVPQMNLPIKQFGVDSSLRKTKNSFTREIEHRFAL
jgi:hypothetical protein